MNQTKSAMNVLKPKTPYLLLLAIFFCIAVTDTLVWSEKVDPVVIKVDSAHEVSPATPDTVQKFASINGDD